MTQELQVEELGTMPLTMLELTAVDGGMTFRQGVYAIDAAALAAYHAVCDFSAGFYAGLTGH